MSCDWNVFCRTCNDEHGFDDANHMVDLMFTLIRHADAIAGLTSLLDSTSDVVLKTHYGEITAGWFKKHLGHDLVARSEYGDIREVPENPVESENPHA